MKAVVARFEKLNPNINIDWSSYTPAQDPSSYQALLTAIAGGQAPDIAEIDRFTVAEFALKGALQPITKYADKSVQAFDKKIPGAWQEVHGFDGQMYGIPEFFSSPGFWSLYYNKTIFAKAHLKPPTTWSQAITDTKKLTAIKGGKITQLGYEPYGDPAGELDNELYSEQGHLLSPDGKTAELTNSTVVKAVEYQNSLMKADGGYKQVLRFMPPKSAPPNMDPFLQGKSAMWSMGDWETQTIAVYKPNLNFAVTFLPTPTGKHPSVWAGGWSLQMTKGAANPQQAYDFLKFMTTEDAALTYTKAFEAYSVKHHQLNILPFDIYDTYPKLAEKYNLKDLRKYPNIEAAVKYWLSVPHKAKSRARERTMVPTELWLAEQNAVQNVLYGKMSVSQSLQQQNQIVQTAITNMEASQ